MTVGKDVVNTKKWFGQKEKWFDQKKKWSEFEKKMLRLSALTGIAVFLGLSLQAAASAATATAAATPRMKQAEALPRPHQAAAVAPTVEYTIVTNEIKSAPKGHPEIAVYRFDPGLIVVNRGDDVVLHFYGVKGPVHPITIAAYGVKTSVARGEIKTVRFHATHAGYFPIVCELHRTLQQHGPMIGTLVVLP